MEENPNDIQSIERYFDNEMSDEEKQDFEKRTQHDEHFKNMVRREKVIIEAVKSRGRDQMKKELQAFSSTLPPVDIAQENRKHLFNQFKYVVGVAASISILLFVIYAIKPTVFIEDNAVAIYDTYFTPVTAQSIYTDRSINNNLTLAYQMYNHGEYASAIAYFLKVDKAQLTPFYQLHLGSAYLANENYQKGIALFETCHCLDNPLVGVHITWYLALAYIHEGEIDKGKALLEMIAEEGYSMYLEEAQEILSKL